MKIKKRLKNTPRLLKLFVLLLIAVSVPVTAYVVKNFKLNSSKAAGSVNLSFAPDPFFVPSTGSAYLSVKLTSTTNHISFAKVSLPFVPVLMKVGGTIIPSTALRNVIQLSTPDEANHSGNIVIVLGQKPGDPPAPLGTFELARIPLAKSTVNSPVSFQILSDTSNGNTQIVDSNAQEMNFTQTPGVIRVNSVLSTPTIKLTPTPTYAGSCSAAPRCSTNVTCSAWCNKCRGTTGYCPNGLNAASKICVCAGGPK